MRYNNAWKEEPPEGWQVRSLGLVTLIRIRINQFAHSYLQIIVKTFEIATFHLLYNVVLERRLDKEIQRKLRCASFVS